jgi:hypothetical protein
MNIDLQLSRKVKKIDGWNNASRKCFSLLQAIRHKYHIKKDVEKDGLRPAEYLTFIKYRYFPLESGYLSFEKPSLGSSITPAQQKC